MILKALYDLAIREDLIPDPDFDHDGIEDIWEMNWFGNLDHDASTDADDDG